LADIAQIVIALGTFGAFIAVVFSARRATEAAADSRRSAELAKALVDAERERLDVELKPRVAFDCYQTKDCSWVVRVTNRGPRDIDELTVKLTDDKTLQSFSGTVLQGTVKPLSVGDSDGLSIAERRVLEFNTSDDGLRSKGAGGDTWTMHDLYVGEPHYLRVSRASREGNVARVVLNYRSGSREWSEERHAFRVPEVMTLEALESLSP
jgi:hypothetical protein